MSETTSKAPSLAGFLLLVMAGLCGPSAGADNGIVLQPTPSTTAPEAAPGGTVVLRGTPPANANVDQAGPGGGPGGGSASNRAAGPVPRAGNYDTGGFDRNYDTTGIDRNYNRNYDTTGFDRNFDRSGLSRP
jgi:hypothetical protein